MGILESIMERRMISVVKVEQQKIELCVQQSKETQCSVNNYFRLIVSGMCDISFSKNFCLNAKKILEVKSWIKDPTLGWKNIKRFQNFAVFLFD